MRVAPRRREHMLMLPRDSARCNRLNNLKQAAKWSSHFESREHAESGRTSGPLCMQITKRDTIGVMAEHL